jgi:hypothetical protein
MFIINISGCNGIPKIGIPSGIPQPIAHAALSAVIG